MPFINSVRGSFGSQGRFGGGGFKILSGYSSITTSGAYTIATFNAGAGSPVTSGAGLAEILMIAGGGSGGNHNTTNANGGGGAGGLVYTSSMMITTAPSLSVGYGAGRGGGNSVCSPGNAGGNSSFTGLATAIGGGGGGSTCGYNGRTGGSGGGSPYPGYGYGEGTAGQGYRGATSAIPWTGGGGGGAGSVGENGGNSGGGSNYSGRGGEGINYSISGAAKWYAGGGGGCGNSSERGGDGPAGAGRGTGSTDYFGYTYYPGRAAYGYREGSGTPDAIDGTGGGGGASSYWACNGNWCSGSGVGGNGVIIIKYLT